MKIFFSLFNDKRILNITLIYIAIILIPSLSAGYLFYFTNVFKMDAVELSYLEIVGGVFGLIALILYSCYFIKYSPKKVFVYMNIFSCFVSAFFIIILL